VQFNPRTVPRRQGEQAADNHQLRRFSSQRTKIVASETARRSASGQRLAGISINLNLVATSQISNKNLRDITPVCPADVAEMTRLSHFGYWA
jgi:hypothetical protein